MAAAAPQKPQVDALSNPYMSLMIAMIFVLLLGIVVLNFSIKSISAMQTTLEKEKRKTQSINPKGMATIVLLLIAGTSFGQDAATATADTSEAAQAWTIYGMSYTLFFALLSAIVFEVIVIVFQLLLIRGLLNYAMPKKQIVVNDVVLKENLFWKKVNASVALEDEADIMFDHEYDGIRELDNNLPPWWKYGFYLTIVFAFVYLIHFHIAKSGMLQEQEYLTEVAEGKAQVAAYLKTAGDNVDENTVKFLEGASDISAGKEIFAGNCVACHGALGEGKVGPNLTDQYWIHKGGIKDIFFSIKYGWSDKGMKSWKDDLTPKQIAQVSSYIKSLVGTNPPNALEPKGELYKEEK